MDYLSIKTLHILSSVLWVGTGFGSAFYLYFANRDGAPSVVAPVARLVVRADGWFTTPAIVLQPLTGASLVWRGGYPLDAAWLRGSVALYLLAGACWLPVVRWQIEMARLARIA